MQGSGQIWEEQLVKVLISSVPGSKVIKKRYRKLEKEEKV